MRICPPSGIMTQQGDGAMTTKNLALAASITMLVAISGQALAGTATPNARYWSEATGPSDGLQAVRTFNAFDAAMAPQWIEPNAYRYHGGPKSNN
jgi:hypothetical protein